MKQRFLSGFLRAMEHKRRLKGEYLAAGLLLLTLTAVGTTSVSMSISRPQVLAVQPQAAAPAAQELSADSWRPSALVPQADEAAGQPQAPEAPAPELPEPEAGLPAPAPEAEPAGRPQEQPQELQAPQEAELPEPDTAPAAAARLEPFTEALGAEDRELQARYTAGRVPAVPEETNGAAAPAVPEGEAADDGFVLLTPEQLEASGLVTPGELDAVDALEEENCLAWLFELLFGIRRSGWYESFGNTYYYDPQTHKAVTGVQIIDGKLYCFNANGVMQDVTFGIDVSRYQQSVDWEKVKAAGAEFVIIRIGYRGYGSGTLVLDPMFESHMAAATAAGLRTGIYFFSQAINEQEAIEEAQGCLYVLQGRALQYPIYFDSEYATSAHTGRADGLTKAQRTACAVAFCETVVQEGYRAGVYASESWFKDNLDFATVSRYSIWNAHYGVSESGIACDLWQASGTATLDGVVGQIDLNVSYIG